jgi:DNA-binding NarL/FixJ family response regulator
MMHPIDEQTELREIHAEYSITPPSAMIKVSIVEDDAKLRETMVRYFAGQSGFKCLGTFPDAESALAGIPQNPPDVVLMDINLPGIDGIECVARLRADLPNLKIIMLTVFEDSERVFNSLSAGAFGYLVKSNRPAKILQAIRDVFEGGSPMSGHIARMVVQSFEKRGDNKDETSSLTPRELEVLHGLSCGQPYKQIAEELGISLSTVRTYIQRIYEKLHVHSQTEAVMKYARRRDDRTQAPS